MSSATTYYQNYLDKNGYTMDKFKNTSRVAYLMEFIENLTPKGGKVLDVGCGDMTLSTLLPKYAWTGIDINTVQSNNLAVSHDLEKFPYPFDNQSFDTIVCSEVLEHMFDPVKITQEIRRLIKQGGRYILSTPNFSSVDNYLENFENIRAKINHPWTYEHIRQYSIESHTEILQLSGFEVEKFVGADAHYSAFYSQGRETLRQFLEKIGLKDENYVATDQLIGAMFPLHNHTIIITAKPV